jgi:hypothetical protein
VASVFSSRRGESGEAGRRELGARASGVVSAWAFGLLDCGPTLPACLQDIEIRRLGDPPSRTRPSMKGSGKQPPVGPIHSEVSLTADSSTGGNSWVSNRRL